MFTQARSRCTSALAKPPAALPRDRNDGGPQTVRLSGVGCEFPASVAGKIRGKKRVSESGTVKTAELPGNLESQGGITAIRICRNPFPGAGSSPQGHSPLVGGMPALGQRPVHVSARPVVMVAPTIQCPYQPVGAEHRISP